MTLFSLACREVPLSFTGYYFSWHWCAANDSNDVSKKKLRFNEPNEEEMATPKTTVFRTREKREGYLPPIEEVEDVSEEEEE